MGKSVLFLLYPDGNPDYSKNLFGYKLDQQCPEFGDD